MTCDLLGVDDDDEVAGVAVRRVLGLALAAQRVGDLGREAAERLALGIDDVPVALAVLGCCYVGLHVLEATKSRAAAERGRSDDSRVARGPRGQGYTAAAKELPNPAVKAAGAGEPLGRRRSSSRGESGPAWPVAPLFRREPDS